MSRLSSSALSAILVAVAALAAPGPSAAQPSGPRVLHDPAKLRINLVSETEETDRAVTARYRVTAAGRAVAARGAISERDRLTLTWAVGGKPIATVPCVWAGDGASAPFTCTGAELLDVHGPVTATFTYGEDADDSTFTMSTHQLTVGRFWNWFERNGKRGYYAKYQVVPLELLTSAVLTHGAYSDPRGVELHGWWSADGGVTPNVSALRCTVDGKRVTDLETSYGSGHAIEGYDWRDPKQNARVPQVRSFGGELQQLKWGPRDPDHIDYPGVAPWVYLGDHPGRWSCDLRADGKAVRTFQFTVGADGRVAPHAEQAAGLALPSGTVMIDALVPDSAPDPYIDPAASRAGGFWGQPWRDAATGPRLAPKRSRPGFEAAPPKGAGKPAKPAKPAKRKPR